MFKKFAVLSFTILATLLFIASTRYIANAQSVIIEDNAAGSQNSVEVNVQDQTNTNQQNSAEVGNDVDVNCDTGNNSTNQNTGSGASTNTGDCQTSVTVTNQLNSNQAQVSCPGCPSPTPLPGQSPPPTQPPAGGANGGGNGNGDGGDGDNGAEGGVEAPEVLAAAGTSVNLVTSLAGLILILSGLHLFVRNLRYADLQKLRK